MRLWASYLPRHLGGEDVDGKIQCLRETDIGRNKQGVDLSFLLMSEDYDCCLLGRLQNPLGND
jgi:hypothetical protein